MTNAMRDYARVFPVGKPRYHRNMGLYFALGGNERKAEYQWKRSLQSAEQFGLACEAGLTHLDRARFATGDNRKQLVEVAISALKGTELKPQQKAAELLVGDR